MGMERLVAGESLGLVYILPYGRLYCIATDISSDGEVLVEMYHGISAMREETAGEGGSPFGHCKGRSFTMMTTDLAEAGYWYIRVRNVSNFAEIVTFDSYARPTSFVEMPEAVKSWKDTIVGWDGKPSKPAAAIAPRPKQDDALYKLMLQKRKANLGQ